MSSIDAHLRVLFRSTLVFGIACGISLALSSLHLDAIGFSKENIGYLAIFFGAGVVLSALPAGVLIRRVSAKWTLVTSLFLYSTTVMAFPFLRSFESIAAIRFMDGVFSAGVWVGSETILLMRAEPGRKAYLTTLYAIWLSSGYVAGPLMAMGIVYVLPMYTAFLVSGVTAIGSGLFALLKLPRDQAPEDLPSAKRAEPSQAGGAEARPADSGKPKSTLALLWSVKTSCFGSFAYGYFQAAAVLFLPLYLMEEKHILKAKTAIFPAMFCLGLLLCSNLFGRIADRVGHLLMMRLLGCLGILCVIGFVFLDAYWLMCLVTFGSGATFATISPISLALQGVIVSPRDYSRSNSVYNVFYASGMLIGPPIAGYIFERYGGLPLIWHMASLWIGFVIFTIVFLYDDPAARRKREQKRKTAGAAAV